MYTMLEAHTITWIEKNPGTTVSEIAKKFNRTMSSISQLITRLEKKELVSKTLQPGESKKIKRLHVTRKGRELSHQHIRYDEKQTEKFIHSLKPHFSDAELNTIYRYFALFANNRDLLDL